jgi:hypothetical protein
VRRKEVEKLSCAFGLPSPRTVVPAQKVRSTHGFTPERGCVGQRSPARSAIDAPRLAGGAHGCRPSVWKAATAAGVMSSVGFMRRRFPRLACGCTRGGSLSNGEEVRADPDCGGLVLDEPCRVKDHLAIVGVCPSGSLGGVASELIPRRRRVREAQSRRREFRRRTRRAGGDSWSSTTASAGHHHCRPDAWYNATFDTWAARHMPKAARDPRSRNRARDA